MSEELIRLVNISKEYDGEKVLDQINLYILRNEFLTLLGPSGCGKTTTLRLIGGFESPTSGDVLFNGKPMQDLPPFKRKVNTVFQRYALFPHMNVFDNVAFGLKIKKMDKKSIEMKVNEMLELVNLPGFGKRAIDSLSGGQQQRVAIARALVNEPEVLLLDEPTNGLDIPSKRVLRKLLAGYADERRTVVVSTHQVRDIEGMIDNVVILDSRGVVLNRTVEEISGRMWFGPVEASDHAIYAEEGIDGLRGILENPAGSDSRPDLEMLFNAAVSEREAVRQLFDR